MWDGTVGGRHNVLLARANRTWQAIAKHIHKRVRPRPIIFIRAQLMNLISINQKGDFLCGVRLLRIFSG